MNEDNQQGADSGRVGSQPCHIRRALALMEANFAAKLSRVELLHARRALHEDDLLRTRIVDLLQPRREMISRLRFAVDEELCRPA